MKKIFRIVVILLLAYSGPAFGAGIPAEFTDEIRAAEQSGKILYDVVQRNPDGESAQNENLQKAREKVTDFCDLEYRAYNVSIGPEQAVYFIATPPEKGHIVFGRHYKVYKNAVVASTKSCFVSPPAPGKSGAGIFLTHLLSEAPSEFHVFLSLKHKSAIYVGTSQGIWAVEHGKISFLEKRK
jgi:hypothetical protein